MNCFNDNSSVVLVEEYEGLKTCTYLLEMYTTFHSNYQRNKIDETGTSVINQFPFAHTVLFGWYKQ
jgi:hypothetical protein